MALPRDIARYYGYVCPWDHLDALVGMLQQVMRQPCMTHRVAYSPATRAAVRCRHEEWVLVKPVRKADTLEMHVSTGAMVLDMDINDSWTLRPCCGSAKTMCDACFPHVCRWCLVMKALIAVTCNIPRSSVMVVFSGRRGFHFWLFGLTAKLSKEWRAQIVNDLRRYRFITKVVPEALQFFAEFPEDVVDAHEFVARQSGAEKCIAFLQHVFPLKFDYNASVAPGHMIRMPFSVHSSGRICLPLSDEFLRQPLAYSDMPTAQSIDDLSPFLRELTLHLDTLSAHLATVA